jgi:hypothetical protein
MRFPAWCLLSTAMSVAMSATMLSGCGGRQAGDASATAAATAEPARQVAATGDADAVAARIADTLEACSYDGEPVRFGLGGDAPVDCRDMIAQVMHFTGLPQNFTVTEADVPNAAAAILLDERRTPQRVIAFNPEFISLVKRATRDNRWAAVSVLAHEVGHHLAGHTIQAGGSQPPIELEADKFSGFVLYKMGAAREDAQVAMRALVPAEVPRNSTHPARDRRLAAISEGWDQACRQTGRGDCDGGAPGALPAGAIAQTPVNPGTPSDLPTTPTATTPRDPVVQRDTATASTKPVVMPSPDVDSLPSKGTQFIYDELGLLDPATVAKHERLFREHAAKHNVEIVTIVAKDLHGMSADDYAWAMLRQLRVGKLDVGNGVVFVIAPDSKAVGSAFGPGVKLAMGRYDDNYRSAIDNFFRFLYDTCRKKGRCNPAITENVLYPATHVADDTEHYDWTIRFASLGALREQVARDLKGNVPLKEQKTANALVRFEGTIASLSPDPAAKFPRVIPPRQAGPTTAVYVKTDDGLHAMVYLDPATERLMPGGKLAEGRRYTFIGREQAISWNAKDTQHVVAFSYSER